MNRFLDSEVPDFVWVIVLLVAGPMLPVAVANLLLW